MLESVTVLANIEYSSERHTIALEQERAGNYVRIVFDELEFRSALEGDDWTIPEDEEEIIRRLRRECALTGDDAREYFMLAERYKVSSLRPALALAVVLEKDRNNDYD